MKRFQKIALALGGIGGLLAIYLGLRQPQWIFGVVSQLKPGALFFVDTEQPVIALTIDDGPQIETTEAILQVLERYDVRATFFMLTDELVGNEAALQSLIAQGHELGHHMTADESSIRLSTGDFQTKFLNADQALSAYGPISWFRPGMGWYNNSMLNFVEDRGYQLVLGSLFPYDTHVPSVQFAEWFVLNNLDPGDILVLHDGPKNRGKRTVRLLERILPEIQERGYRVVTLTELKTYGDINSKWDVFPKDRI
ncbi:MAG: chitin deacetylase family protein [Cyanobacteria bacterium P01_F01_bin.13]